MKYQITPDQAKELKDKIESLLPSPDVMEVVDELCNRVFGFDIPNTSYLGWEIPEKYSKLKRELEKMECIVLVMYSSRDMRVFSVGKTSPEAIKLVRKLHNMGLWIDRLNEAIKIGLNIHINPNQLKGFRDCLNPIDMEWAESVIKEEFNKPLPTKEEILKFAEDFLKEYRESEEKLAYESLLKLSDDAYTKSFDTSPKSSGFLGEDKSPVSCFTIGAIGAFIVFAIGFIISFNI